MKEIQSFGTNAINKKDLITKIYFSECKKYLFVGDHCGRLVIFEKNNNLWTPLYQGDKGHIGQIDYLTGRELPDRITDIKQVNVNINTLDYLVSDSKKIYYWKISNQNYHTKKAVKLFKNRLLNKLSQEDYLNKINERKQCSILHESKQYLKNTYEHGHEYEIHSIDYNNIDNTFISSDDLRINLWNIEVNNKILLLYDSKPNDMSTLTETITCAKFDPSSKNIIYSSSSQGFIRQHDMRINNHNEPTKILYTFNSKKSKYSFEYLNNALIYENKNTYTSSFDISSDGQYLSTRDIIYTHIWDLRMNKPIHSVGVNNHLSKSIFYSSDDIICNKFEITFNNSNTHVYTGSFNNIYKINIQTGELNYYNEIERDTDIYNCSIYNHISFNNNQFAISNGGKLSIMEIKD